MKKKLIFLVVAFMAMGQSILAYDFSAVSPSGHTLYYNIVSGNAELVRPGGGSTYNNYVTGNVVIPSSVTFNSNTYYVTSLANGAFSGCTNLASVTIPASVTSIGSTVFMSCSGLTTVNFNATNCTSMGSSSSPVFFSCTNFSTLNIGSNVTTIPSYAFYGCRGLTSVTIPDSVTSIGTCAFYNCIGLTSVTFGNSLTSIANGAFSNCSSLTSVTIPASVTNIGGPAFYGCSSLTTVNFNATNCTTMGTGDFPVFNNCENIATLNIGANVTRIPAYAFKNCSGLTAVTIPDSVTNIGDQAFANCSGLTSVTFNATNCTSMGSYSNPVFSGCSNFATLTIGANVTTIPSYAFNGCSGLTSFVIPDSVTSIGNYAFRGCSSLTSVTVPVGVTTIGGNAFYNCSGLTSVTFNATNCTAVGTTSAFSFCTNIQTLTIGTNVTKIPNYAFMNCSALDTVYMNPTIPPTVGNYAFAGNASNRVFILSGCTYNAYYNASSWTSYRSALRGPVIDIDINLAANDTMRGHAAIVPTADSSDIACDSTSVIHATANYGYYFAHWNDGDTNNPRTITLTQDTTFTAIFNRNEYQLTLSSTDTILGTVSGSGTYFYLDTVQIAATAIDHHHLVQWSDGNRNATRAIIITADLQLTASFAIDTHTVSVVPNDSTLGMVEASGTEYVYGTTCTVTATAYMGYTFLRWSDGQTDNPYTFTVTSDVELTAIFMETYTVTVNVNDSAMGTAMVNGSVSATVTDGTEVTLTATANEGYRFVRWDDNDTNAVRTITVTSDMSFTAYFAAVQGIEDIEADGIRIYSAEGRIVVKGATDEVCVFDMMGRGVRNNALPAGVYLVKVGDHPARKVVVVR